MTCIKTGCHIWIEPYQEYAYGDAFEIEPVLPDDAKIWRFLANNKIDKLIRNTAYFNLVTRSMEPINGNTSIHYTIHDYAGWFGKDTNHQFLITNNFTRETRSI